MSLQSPSHGELTDPLVSYSFYTRPEDDGMYHVVNYHTPDWWIQLDVVFAKKRSWLRRVSYDARPIFNKERQGILIPRKVVAGILHGIKDACSDRHIQIAPKWFSFTNADFECYELYEHAAGHLVRHLADNGQFGRQEIIH